jgi:hypothetical protein
MSIGPSAVQLDDAMRWCVKQMHERRVPGQHPSHMLSTILKEADAKFALDSFGVEGFCSPSGDNGVSYLNMGDSYSTTLVAVAYGRTGDWNIEVKPWADYAALYP